MPLRRILGFALLLLAPYLLFAAVGLISEQTQHARSDVITDRLKGAAITFSAYPVNTTFNGDCTHLQWSVEGTFVKDVYVVDAPSMGSGEMQNCDGTTPRLRVVFQDGTSHTWTIPVQRTFDDPDTALRAWLLLVPSVLCLIAGVRLSRVYQSPLFRRSAVQIALALVFAAVWVFVLDLFTNSLNIYRYVWDHYHYIDMAQNGVVGSEGLVGPYAYRPAVPLLARFIAHFSERTIITGFRIVTYAGVISQLVLVFSLARQFTRKWWIAWTIMLVIALSTYHVKFLLFDIYRPDSLAFTLILIGMLAYVQRQRRVGNAALYEMLILLTSVIGLFVREFCALPAGLLAFRLLLEFVRTRRPQPLIKAVGITGIILLIYWIPQQLIIVERTDQLLNSDLSNLGNIVTNVTRNFNILLGTAIYLLPLIVLLTPERARRLWVRMGDYRVDVALYGLIVLGLALVGGSDIVRFVVYLFVPMIIMLALLLDDGVHPLEVVYALVATAVYNRILAPVPQQNLEAYLDFYIVWHDRTSPALWLRAGELLLWLIGAFILRGWLRSTPTAETSEKRRA